jgi:hypothetical protein
VAPAVPPASDSVDALDSGDTDVASESTSVFPHAARIRIVNI